MSTPIQVGNRRTLDDANNMSSRSKKEALPKAGIDFGTSVGALPVIHGSIMASNVGSSNLSTNTSAVVHSVQSRTAAGMLPNQYSHSPAQVMNSHNI